MGLRSPEQVARRTLKAIRRNERQVLITPMAHLLFQIKRFFPSLIDMANGFSRRGRKRRLQQVEAMESHQTVNPLAAAEDQPQRKSA